MDSFDPLTRRPLVSSPPARLRTARRVGRIQRPPSLVAGIQRGGRLDVVAEAHGPPGPGTSEILVVRRVGRRDRGSGRRTAATWPRVRLCGTPEPGYGAALRISSAADYEPSLFDADGPVFFSKTRRPGAAHRDRSGRRRPPDRSQRPVAARFLSWGITCWPGPARDRRPGLRLCLESLPSRSLAYLLLESTGFFRELRDADPARWFGRSSRRPPPPAARDEQGADDGNPHTFTLVRLGEGSRLGKTGDSRLSSNLSSSSSRRSRLQGRSVTRRSREASPVLSIWPRGDQQAAPGWNKMEQERTGSTGCSSTT